MVRARVVGAAGFGGANIIELLTAHPEAEIVSLVDVQGTGSVAKKNLESFQLVYPIYSLMVRWALPLVWPPIFHHIT